MTECSGVDAHVEEAVEVGEVEGVCDVREDVEGELSLVRRLLLQGLTALIRGAAQRHHVAGV